MILLFLFNTIQKTTFPDERLIRGSGLFVIVKQFFGGIQVSLFSERIHH